MPPARASSQLVTFTPRVLLIPKLRSQLVEFLNEGSLVHLGILTPTYLCRFAVRTLTKLATRIFSTA